MPVYKLDIIKSDIICVILGMAVYFIFLSFIGYASVLLIDSGLFSLYERDFVDNFESAFARKFLISAIWIPIEFIIVIVSTVSLSFFTLKQTTQKKSHLVLFIFLGTTVADISYSSYNHGVLSMSYFLNSWTYLGYFSVFINLVFWCLYFYLALVISDFLQTKSNRLKTIIFAQPVASRDAETAPRP